MIGVFKRCIEEILNLFRYLAYNAHHTPLVHSYGTVEKAVILCIKYASDI